MTVNAGTTPPVVFVAALGTGGDSWKPVIEVMGCGSTTVTYDRPGTGSAPPRKAPNPPLTYGAFADELAVLLDEHGVGGPAVVVGHSVRSLVVRVFAGRYPDRVAGVVHVDGSIPRLSLWPVSDEPQDPDGDGPDATELDILVGEVEVVEAAPLPSGTPSAVIARTPGRWIDGDPSNRADPLWTAYQRQLARLCGVPLVVADDAGHQIPREAPALVAYLIDQVVAAVRSGSGHVIDGGGIAAVGGVAYETAAPFRPALPR